MLQRLRDGSTGWAGGGGAAGGLSAAEEARPGGDGLDSECAEDAILC
eukprot:COSAG02_NODE_41344_length_395_cov_1.378378_1_plen_46_part_01